jgi:putative flippase GtrA
MKLKKNQRKELTRIVEYMVSGGAYFWSGYLAFFLLDKGFHWGLWWARLASNMTGWLVNYGLQRYWVFNNPNLKKNQTEVTGRYIFITAVDFVLDYFLIKTLKGIGITPYIGSFISASLFTVWNYLWYRLWVFPEKLKKKPVKVGVGRVVAHRAHGTSAYHGAK